MGPLWLTNAVSKRAEVHRVYRKLTPTWHNTNRYTGIYGSFSEATAAIPRGRQQGYDSKELASWYRERLDRPFSDDYPVMFWLKPLVRAGQSVFDFGGHVGLHYFGWRKHLGTPDAVRWQVCDVPAVVESGRELAQQRNAPKTLSYTAEPKDSDGFDVFMASGSLQYLEGGFLEQLLSGLKKRPRYVLLNKLPVHPTTSFVTVQDTALSYHPYFVTSRADLLQPLERLGYRLRDEWYNPEHDCPVMLRPDRSVKAYSGFLFTHADAPLPD